MSTQGQGQELDGVWTVVSAEREQSPNSRFLGTQFIFRGDRFVMQRGDRRMADGTYRVDPSKEAKEIDMVEGDRSRVGIYKVEGDQLTLCFTDGTSEPRPTTFATRVGSVQ